MERERKGKLGAKNVFVILMLGTLGQLAWSLENSWFNTYTYDCVTKDTAPIAWMNALSAITATLTTFIMGTLSDERGKRKPFIRYGYLIWGIFTAGFILSGSVKDPFWGAVLVVVLDCVMTFFGSTAYDACYNAWLTDISDENNRGQVTMLSQLGLCISGAIGLGAGAVVDNFGYPAFFIGVGALISVLGFVFGGMVKEGDSLKPTGGGKGMIRGILHSFSGESFRKHRELFLVLFCMLLVLTGFQVSYAYETIYANNYVGISKSVSSLLMAPVAPVAVAVAVIAGRAADRGRGAKALLASPFIFAAGAFIHCFAKDALILGIGKAVLYGGMMLMTVSTTAMFKNLSPEDERGHFEGVRMVFQVLLPMVIGPTVGSLLIKTVGLGPVIYLVTGIVSLLALLPAWLLLRKEGAAER